MKNEMAEWSAERKLAYLVDQLKNKVGDWKDYQCYDYCHCEERCSCADNGGQERAYGVAADDVEWMLRSLGLLEGK